MSDLDAYDVENILETEWRLGLMFR